MNEVKKVTHVLHVLVPEHVIESPKTETTSDAAAERQPEPTNYAETTAETTEVSETDLGRTDEAPAETENQSPTPGVWSEVERIESGYHLSSIADALGSLYEKHKDECDKTYSKYFGDGTDYAKLRDRMLEISKKPMEEQTDEDREHIRQFVAYQAALIEQYKNEALCVRSTYTENGKEIEILSGDLKSLAENTKKALFGRKEIAELLSSSVFDIMKKSDMKAISIVMQFDSAGGSGSNTAAMLIASPFFDMGAADVAALESRLQMVHDTTIKEMREKLGIPAPAEDPVIIT